MRCLCIPDDGKVVVATQHRQQTIVRMHSASLNAAASGLSTPSLCIGSMFRAASASELWIVPKMPCATVLALFRAYGQSLQETCQAEGYAIAIHLEAEKHGPRHSVAQLSFEWNIAAV